MDVAAAVRTWRLYGRGGGCVDVEAVWTWRRLYGRGGCVDVAAAVWTWSHLSERLGVPTVDIGGIQAVQLNCLYSFEDI